MENISITIDVMIDSKIFRKFAIFDNLHRQRRWVSPVIFASLMSAFACVCFVMRGSAAHAVMLGCVLLLIGLGLPAVHVWSFFNSIKSQVKAHKLEKPRAIYSLRLSCEHDGVSVTNPAGESAGYEWGSLYGAYRVDGCTYLYVTNNKAFLLPDGQVKESTDSLWSLLAEMLPSEKLHDHRRGKK